MTVLDRVLAWAPPYPEVFTAPEAQRGIAGGAGKGRVFAALTTAAKYGIVENVGSDGRTTLWRLARPEGAPRCDPPVVEPLVRCADVLDAWVRTLAPGREFTIPEAVDACPPFTRSTVITELKAHPAVELARTGAGGRRGCTVYRRCGE